MLQTAADKIGWGKGKFGIAGGFEKGSYVATCVEVRVDAGKPARVVRVVQAYECGAVVNPDQLRNQNEGAVIMGLGGALFEAISFENGKILNPHFARYRVPRFRDVPQIEIVLVDRKRLAIGGSGRDSDHDAGSGDRQRDLRDYRGAVAVDADVSGRAAASRADGFGTDLVALCAVRTRACRVETRLDAG